MVCGESGIEPIKYKIWKRMVTYWHLTCIQGSKFSSRMVELQSRSRQGQYPWVEAIKVILGNCELDIAYTLPKWFLHDRLKASVKENLKRLTHRQWQEAMEINELCQTYKQHKTELEQEKYLSMFSIENYFYLK